ncbi:Hypothetical predicted protein [Mytilus galloprovincialis]|uniref:Uncharacterized protein n=1 Tax=Mytilus galloprovincialis TaxID=29158 RepID=A0A8B6DJR4_MYTGA|nr:Hypothetical predicted protein [Mytilus galloprovincialis]
MVLDHFEDQVFGMCSSFKLKCPNHSQWSFRARAFCSSDPSKYSCIQNEHIKGYTEGCSIAQFEKGGMKIILRGNLDAGPCSEVRYQPGQIKFLANVSSECIFSKSKCNEEGQILHDKGSPTQDVQNYAGSSRQTSETDFPDEPNPEQEDSTTPVKIIIEQAGGNSETDFPDKPNPEQEDSTTPEKISKNRLVEPTIMT